MRRFELVERTSAKFWEIWTDGVEVHTRYGRIGAAGQETIKVAATEVQASKLEAKLVQEKTGKGYGEVRAATAARVAKPTATTKATAAPTSKTVRQAPSTTASKATTATRPIATKPSKAIKGFPLAFEATLSDVNHGVVAIRDGNRDLIVAGAGHERRKVVLQSSSGLFPRYPSDDINGLKVVRHQGEPCLAVSLDAADGPAIGLFRADGSRVAIRYVLDEATRRSNYAANKRGNLGAIVRVHTKLLAVTRAGDALAWSQGSELHLITTDAFVAGKKATVYKDDPHWATFGDDGLLYTHRTYKPNEDGWYTTYATAKKEKKIIKGPGPSARLLAYDGGLINAYVVVSGGKLRPIKSKPWRKAIDPGRDDFECTTAAGTGDVVCVGPGAIREPHLCFVQLSTGKLLSTKKDFGRGGSKVYLMDDTLYVIRAKRVDSTPWPADGVLKAR